jgi:hypothetical protein
MMTGGYKYQEQLDRVRRWYQRFKEISEGRPHDRASDYYQDDVYAFFMNCYHLKEWIKNDPAHSPLGASVETFISNNPDMALCADICNGIKHLTRNRNPRTAENPKFGNRKFKVGVGTETTTIAVEYTINTTSGPVNAFDLATRCLRAWDDYITNDSSLQRKDGGVFA